MECESAINAGEGSEPFLFLALMLPTKRHSDDPDQLADDIVRSLKFDGWGNVMVGLIPSPQFLNTETLANLRAAASGKALWAEGTKHPLAIDLADLVDELPAKHRAALAHVASCAPCRRGVVNLIQSSPGYPDLFGDHDRYWDDEPAGPR